MQDFRIHKACKRWNACLHGLCPSCSASQQCSLYRQQCFLRCFVSLCLLFHLCHLIYGFVGQAPEMFEGKRISEKVRHQQQI